MNPRSKLSVFDANPTHTLDSELLQSKKIHSRERKNIALEQAYPHRTRKTLGNALIALGILVCPCHLVITLPLLAAILSSTALGIILSDYALVFFGVATVLFIFGLFGGSFLVNGAHRHEAGSCRACDSKYHKGANQKGKLD